MVNSRSFVIADTHGRTVSYVLVASPPVPANTSPAPVIKEWGSSVDAEECFTLAELEEFHSTDFKSQPEPHLFLLPMDKIIPPARPLIL